MVNAMRYSIKLLALIIFLAAAGRAWAADEFSIESGSIDLQELARVVSQSTGRTILYGPDFKGEAELISPGKALTKDQLWEFFLSALAKNGWAVVLHGKVARVVPRPQMAGQDQPVVMSGDQGAVPDSDSQVTVTMELSHSEAGAVAMQVAPLVSPDGRVIPLVSKNQLLISDSAANVEKIRKVVEAIDAKKSTEEIEVIRLRRAKASDLASLLTKIFSDYTIEAKQVRTREKPGRLVVVPEVESSSLVLRGDAADVKAAQKLAAKIDGMGEPGIYIQRLQHLNAAEMAGELKAILR